MSSARPRASTIRSSCAAGAGGAASTVSAVVSSNPAVVVTAVKVAEDGNDVIVRCYESSGGRSTTNLSTAFSPAAVTVCNLLEEPLAAEATAATLTDDGILVELRPFQILTIRLRT